MLEQLTYNAKDPLLFNSGFFLFFIFIFFFFYQFLYKKKLTRVIYFTIFSLYFFYKACGFYVSLIIISAIVDFSLSNWIYRVNTPAKKKALLFFSVIINLGLLCYFKYTDLFISIINDAQLGRLEPLNLVLPIGISFYTFENLSYTIDVYRGQFKPVTSFLDYLFFLSFFPKLVMGPIVRASDFIPQIRQDILVTQQDIGRGLYLILGGLFKKIVISDFIYVNFVQYIFDDPARYSGIECLFGVYGYAMVIYCDFSGYSDMAIGMAQWMGFKIPMNFDLPYQSSSITEFWRRWHISLSSWLRDYLYIALGGNRKGKIRLYINLMLTMLLGGLWHGASLKFVFWGGMHGVALAIDKMIMDIRKKFFNRRQESEVRSPKSNQELPTPDFRLPTSKLSNLTSQISHLLSIVFTFHFVCFCWIFFKANTFDDAIIIIRQITGNFNGKAFIPMMQAYTAVFAVMGIGYLIHFTPKGMQLKLENLVTDMPVIGKVALLFIFIWLAVQVKQADQVMPIYLQF
ncbi:MAG: MBOAT family protein [Bacteroidetes bacterium]|nr:MBOAT family protein [Bacteroidota bacterium]